MDKVLDANSLLEGLAAAPLTDFKSELAEAHEQLVAEESDELGNFIKSLIEKLYASGCEQKLGQVTAYYQGQLASLEYADIFSTYLYLDSLVKDPGCFAVLRAFYDKVKEIFSANSLKDMKALLSPRSFSAFAKKGPSGKSIPLGRFSDEVMASPGRPRKKPPGRRSRAVSPRLNKALFEKQKTSQLERSPAAHKKQITDADIKDIIGTPEEVPPTRVLPAKVLPAKVQLLKVLRPSVVLSDQALPTQALPEKLENKQHRRVMQRSQSFTRAPQVWWSGNNTPANGSPKFTRKKKSNSAVLAERKRSRSFTRGSTLVTTLQKAAKVGEVNVLLDSVESLQEKKMLDAYLLSGMTMLFWGIEHNSIALAIRLLKNGASLECRDRESKTPLMVAIDTKKEAFWMLFIERGADVSAVDALERTALHYAAKNGLCEVIAQLLTKDPTLLDEQDTYGYTALMAAIIHDMPEAVTLLLGKGADAVTYKDGYGNTGLHHCAASQTCSTQIICAQIRYTDVEQLNARNSEGFTALMSAVHKKNTEACQWLIEQGADVTCVDDQGDTLLHVCAREGYIECPILKMPFSINSQNKKGYTPLMFATEFDHREFCEKLLGLDARLCVKNSKGDTALHIAAQYGNMFMCSLFLKHDPLTKDTFINLRNGKGYTPLMCAVEGDHDHIVIFLLAQGADTQCLSKEGKVARQLAKELGSANVFYLANKVCPVCKSDHTFSQESFLCDVRQGKRANVQMHAGNNLLIVDSADEQRVPVVVLAAGLGHLEMVKLMLKCNADRKVIPQAIKEAESNGHEKVVEFLKKM